MPPTPLILEKTAAKKIIGDIGLAVMILGKGNVSGVKDAEDKHTDSLLGDINIPLEILSNGQLIGAKRSSEEDANADDLVDLGVLTNGLYNHYGGGVVNVKREEDNGVGPVEVGSPVLDVNNL